MKNKAKEPPPTEEQLSQFELESLAQAAEHERIARTWLSDTPPPPATSFQTTRLALIFALALLTVIWIVSDDMRQKP